jgi:transcriptional regulator with XRE-family HTH domain
MTASITNMEYFKKLGLYIRKRRLETGLSLNKFCFEYELEPNTLSRYENAKREPKLSYIMKIAKSFNQTLPEFLADFEKKLYD